MLDALRILMLGGFLFLVLISVDILIRYAKVASAGDLLPQHIWLIVLSYLAFVGGALVSTLEELGEDFDTAMPLRALGLFVGLLALWRVRQHVLRKGDVRPSGPASFR